MTLLGALHRWDRFLFEARSPLNICVLRIFYGLLLFANVFLIWPDRHLWFGEAGFWTSAQAVRELGLERLNLMIWINLPWEINAWFIFLGLISILIIVGLFSNLVIGISFVMLVSMAHRNNLILSGGDTLLRLIGFFLMLSPCGVALSLDAKRANRSQWDPRWSAPWSMRFLQLQLCLVYFVTAYWKLQGKSWSDGSAVGIVLNLSEFLRFPLPDIVRGPEFSKVFSYCTLIVELSFSFLIWFKDTRKMMLVCGIMLHLGLEYSLNIQLFQPIILSLYVLFMDPEFLRGVFKRIYALS